MNGIHRTGRIATLTVFGFFGIMTLEASASSPLSPAVDKKGTSIEGDRIPTDSGDLVIRPIDHATLALQHGGKTIYIDPVGGAGRFKDLPPPSLILITDIHGDHLDPKTIEAVKRDKTVIVAPKDVAEKLQREKVTVLQNGESKKVQGLQIEAVPMYNLTEERRRFHTKGRGNGYVITLGGKRIYISGDTEDIPEMRKLKDVDVAFVCMNLPYTMNVEKAADAVREFKPKVVYPYHYRGREGKSDLKRFEKLVGNDLNIEVRLREWYR